MAAKIFFGVALFCFLVTDYTTLAQIKWNSIDSLSKYSYLIVSIDGEKGEQLMKQLGTGFFYRSPVGNPTFLTAKHMVSEMNTFTKQPIGRTSKFIGIRYYNTKKGTFDIAPLNLSTIKPHIVNCYFYEKCDFIYFEVDLASMPDAQISYINDLFKPVGKSETIERILSWGYAKTDKAANNKSLQTVPINFYNGRPGTSKNVDPEYPYPDSINYITQPKSISGMSGSPVFIKYSINKNGKKVEGVRFGGVMFGTDSLYNAAYIVRPEIVTKEFEHASIHDVK